MTTGKSPLHCAKIGEYELLMQMGKGGFGSVYLGRDHAVDSLVAVKILRTRHRDNPDIQARFLQEMRVVGKLTPQPNVVHAHHASEENAACSIWSWITSKEQTCCTRSTPRNPSASPMLAKRYVKRRWGYSSFTRMTLFIGT